ncbi:MAG: hypothetical protein Q9173_003063 [Seirophora scorigena]
MHTPLALLGISTALFLIYSIYVFVARVYLSPRRRVPGQKLAIWSFWYEFYYDVVLQGRYTWKIAELHEQHGPIVRINPYEVHINVPDFYDELYVMGGKRKTEQWSWTYSSVIQACVDNLCTRLEEHRSSGKKVNLMHAWTAFTGNVVSTYYFPAPYGLLDRSDFAPEFFKMWVGILSGSHLLKQTGEDDLFATGGGRPSIFETLLDSDLPPFDKSVARLVDDAQTLVGAGSITTSLALSIATYFVVSDARMETRLTEELTRPMPSPNTSLPLHQPEQLPYLSATVLEALRFSYGTSHRLQRVCPDQSIAYNAYALPPGTPISKTTVDIHDNPLIFPDPRSIRPERWLPLETEGARLQKYLVSFGRGSRQCLGMHLGTAELYVGLAQVFRRFGGAMAVVDKVKERDVDLTHDFFTPMARPESKGIFVMIREGLNSVLFSITPKPITSHGVSLRKHTGRGVSLRKQQEGKKIDKEPAAARNTEEK